MLLIRLDNDSLRTILVLLSFQDLFAMCMVSKDTYKLAKAILESKYQLVKYDYRREKQLFWREYLLLKRMSFISKKVFYEQFYEQLRLKYGRVVKRENFQLRIL